MVGLALTIVRERTDSVAAGVLMHSGYNFTLFALLWIGSDHFRHLDKLAELDLTPMASAREQLLQMLAEKSFRLGNFKLSSGGTSDYYIDCRLTTLDAEGAWLTGETVLAGDRKPGLEGQCDRRSYHGRRSHCCRDLGDQRAAGQAD